MFVTLGILTQESIAQQQTTYQYDAVGNRYQGDILISSAQRAMAPISAIKKELPAHDGLAMLKAMTLGISIYPTIVNELINITISTANEHAPALVEIYDNLGRSIMTKKINTYNQEQINFSSVKNGIYNISIKMKDQQVFYKVVKGN